MTERRRYQSIEDNNAAVQELKALEALQNGDVSGFAMTTDGGLYQNLPATGTGNTTSDPWSKKIEERRRLWETLKELYGQ